MLKKWFGKTSDFHEEHLDSFNQLVHAALLRENVLVEIRTKTRTRVEESLKLSPFSPYSLHKNTSPRWLRMFQHGNTIRFVASFTFLSPCAA